MKPQYTSEHGMMIDGNYWLVHPQTGQSWDKNSVADFIDNYVELEQGPSLEELKQQAVTKIKQQAGDKVTASDWRLQRAQDRVSHAELTTADNSTELKAAKAELLAVLKAREAIRQASNAAETQLLALEDKTAVEQFTWSELTADDSVN